MTSETIKNFTIDKVLRLTNQGMKKLIGFILFIAIGLTSCDNYKEVKNEEMNGAFIINSSANFNGYYYMGSDNEFNYFESRWDLSRDKYFKIPIDKLRINDTLKFDKDGKELRIDLFKSDNKKFAENEFHKLYVVRDK